MLYGDALGSGERVYLPVFRCAKDTREVEAAGRRAWLWRGRFGLSIHCGDQDAEGWIVRDGVCIRRGPW